MGETRNCFKVVHWGRPCSFSSSGGREGNRRYVNNIKRGSDDQLCGGVTMTSLGNWGWPWPYCIK